jgi:N-acetylmuramoyl-L-alanine amidase
MRIAALVAAAALALSLAAALPAPKQAQAATYTSYTVSTGDSLWKIATTRGTTVSALQSLNGLSGTTVYPGQTLKVPSSVTTYTVRNGDSLWGIAQRFGTTVSALKSLNGLGSSAIYPGQRLVVAGSGGAVTTSRSSAASLSSTDLDLVARLVRAEAESEPHTGQVAVAAVVLNRVRSSRFPNTVRGVIYAPHQFETVSNGRINMAARDVDLKAARDALGGWDPSNGALFFYNPRYTSSSYMRSLTVTARIGNHVFAR